LEKVKKRVFGILNSGRVCDHVWTIVDKILRGHLIEQEEEEYEDLDDCSNFCRTRSNSRGE